MKAIMLSVKPEYVEKILNNTKTIEIRKSKPSCELPCKVYIYCTKGKSTIAYIERKGENDWFGNIAKQTLIVTRPKYDYMNYFNETLGKVVAEFTLNKITRHEKNYIGVKDRLSYNFLSEDVKRAGFVTSDMDEWEKLDGFLKFDNFIENYGDDKPIYAWHIDDLKIYDKPKELSDFKKENKCHYANYEDVCCFENCIFYDLGDCDGRCSKLDDPPQSWCYVEEL